MGVILSYNVEFYKRINGEVPVQEFLINLPSKVRAKAILEIELLKKHGLDLREPYTKALRGKKYKGIYELRIRFSSDSARIFYFMLKKDKFILLNGFVKKTSKTPIREIERALRYRDDFERRFENE